MNLKPTRYDHDQALKACWSITNKGKEDELMDEVTLLNNVAAGYAANDLHFCKDISERQFQKALDKVFKG